LFSAWFFNSIQNKFSTVFLRFAWFIYAKLDKGLIEMLFGSFSISYFVELSQKFKVISSKAIFQHYFFWITLTGSIIFFIFF